MDQIPARRGRGGSEWRFDARDAGKDKQFRGHNVWIEGAGRECEPPFLPPFI